MLLLLPEGGVRTVVNTLLFALVVMVRMQNVQVQQLLL